MRKWRRFRTAKGYRYSHSEMHLEQNTFTPEEAAPLLFLDLTEAHKLRDPDRFKGWGAKQLRLYIEELEKRIK